MTVYITESWLCIDCGFNTAPGFLSRAGHMDAIAEHRPVEEAIDDQAEVYTVRNSVWKAAGMEPFGGCLCIGCLEKRIGRRLKPKDFPRNDPFNDSRMPGTARLLSRRK